MYVNLKHAQAISLLSSSSSMAEGLRDHQESNESEVCDDVIDVPNPIRSLLDKLQCPSTSDLARKRKIKTNPLGKKMF